MANKSTNQDNGEKRPLTVPLCAKGSIRPRVRQYRIRTNEGYFTEMPPLSGQRAKKVDTPNTARREFNYKGEFRESLKSNSNKLIKQLPQSNRLMIINRSWSKRKEGSCAAIGSPKWRVETGLRPEDVVRAGWPRLPIALGPFLAFPFIYYASSVHWH